MWQLPPLTPDEILDYLRKSRTDDPTLDVSEVLAKHEQMLDEWVDRNLPGIGPIPEENRYREVVSGETIESRPEIKKLLQRIESPRVKAILIVEPQRLSRGDLEDIGRIVKLLRYSNTLVITLNYTYDLHDERDRDLFERELKRGNEFLEYQKRIMNNGRLLSVRNGNFIGQTAPYGYKKVQIKEEKRKCYTLEPDPEKAPIVKLIFELYRDGYGMTRISDKLDALGVPSPSGGKWVPDTIPRMLKNEHYLGKVVWNRRPQLRKIVDGDVVVSRPTAEEYLIYEGKHPAIIDQALWDAVQVRRGTIPPNKKAYNFVNPLSGLLYCKKCGKAMTRRTYKDKDGKERSAPRVACTNQRRCHTASACIDEVINEVAKVIQSTIEDFEVRVNRDDDDRLVTQHQMIKQMEARLQELQELEIAQWNEKMKGKMPPHVFDRLNEQTLREIKEAKEALAEAQKNLPVPVNLQDRLVTFKDALTALLNPEAPAKEKNNLLKACIARIDYDRVQVNKGHKKAGDSDTPIELEFTLKL